jgi:hypothetical protein
MLLGMPQNRNRAVTRINGSRLALLNNVPDVDMTVIKFVLDKYKFNFWKKQEV